MQRHITVRRITVFVVGGLALQGAQPLMAQSMRDNFTNWLSNMVTTPAGDSLHEQIGHLSQDETNWDALFREASLLVRLNQDDFRIANLPGAEGKQESDQPESSDYRWILLEWNQFRAENDLAKATTGPIKMRDRVAISDHKLPIWSHSSISEFATQTHKYNQTKQQAPNPVFRPHTRPLSGGTAIGAP